MKRNEITGLVVAVVALVLLFVGLEALSCYGIWDVTSKLNTGQIMEVIVLFVLVLVTVVYAKRTSEIGTATREQAEEMKRHRYDAVRPIIDIERSSSGEEQIREAMAARSREMSYGLWCVLRDIGVGPATDVHANTVISTFEDPRPDDFGTIEVGGSSQAARLSIEQKGDRTYLSVWYRDVHSRRFESRREVNVNQQSDSWDLGSLQVEETAIEECSK
ncbi:MAG: hypothetical protein SVP26_11525 [Chloroflexota bacterium]|nr:hypothetical protein [Chloroflexota bacterium]